MKELLKYTRVNVNVKDAETGELLFEDHNLFVDAGRGFIASVLRAAISGAVIQPSIYVCDLGEDATTPTAADVDLVSYIPGASAAVNIADGYPAALSGEPTGIYFQFSYNNPTGHGDITIRELGLFYRPDSNDFPRRGLPAAPGTMLARLKTSYSSIVVGDSRTITIDWKILF